MRDGTLRERVSLEATNAARESFDQDVQAGSYLRWYAALTERAAATAPSENTAGHRGTGRLTLL
jgi:hypothetical protein